MIFIMTLMGGRYLGVWERERERYRDRDREAHRETERQSGKQTDRRMERNGLLTEYPGLALNAVFLPRLLSAEMACTITPDLSLLYRGHRNWYLEWRSNLFWDTVKWKVEPQFRATFAGLCSMDGTLSVTGPQAYCVHEQISEHYLCDPQASVPSLWESLSGL